MVDPKAKEEFERCWPWLEASSLQFAFRHDGKVWPTHSKEHIWDRIAHGKAFFWPCKECAFVTEILISPTGLKSHHTWLAGGKLEEIAAMTPKIEAWGKQRGCHRQTGNGRRGLLRALEGYRELGTRREKSLL